MSANPFLSQWLSAANAASGTWRSFWTAEMARQQTALMAEFNRQAMQFWTGAWARQVGAMAPGVAQATGRPTAPAPLPVPQVAEAVPLPAAPAEAVPVPAAVAPAMPDAVSPAVEALAAEAKPKAPRKPAQLRAAVQRRKAAPAKTPTIKSAPAKPSRGKGARVTRH